MSHLVLELRPGEMMVVNGATIRFRSKCRVELVSQARFLFGKQIMAAHEAETVMRQLYYGLQTAYVGAVEERDAAAHDVQNMLTRLQGELPPRTADALRLVEASFRKDDFYKALKLLRVMIHDENQERSAVGEDLVETSLTNS
jgi:flagellar protein FlbT